MKRAKELKILTDKLEGSLKEIAELKTKLEESERKYYDLYENAPDMYHTIDTKGIIIDCNKTEAEVLGYSKEDIIGRSVLNIQTEGSRRIGKSAMKKLFRNGKIKGLELQFVKKSGEVMDVSINATVIYDKNGKPVGTRSVIRDITKKKRMVEIIKNSKIELQATIDAITDGICLLDKGLTIERINKSMARLFGKSPVEFIERKCYTVFENRERMCEGCKVMGAFISGEAVIYNHIKNLGDGTSIEFEVSVFPVKGDKKKIEQVVYYMKDITEKRRLERQLEYSRTLASLGEMVTGVAHEIRTPLQNILTGVDLLESEAKKKDLSLEVAENLRDFAVDMNYIVQELLDFSKPVKLELEERAVTDIIDETIKYFNPQIKKGKITVSRRYNRPIKKTSIDVRRIKHVFHNIIENSINAMPEGGEITAAAELYNDNKGEFVRFRFSDTGCGIPAKNIDKVFNPFFSTRTQGIGMGLAVAKKFIKLHNGEISIASKEGKGCEVTILLPVKS
ncbi:MAG: PAS domain S-box protein [Nitrospinae bacterium]|nr:PAS domain S-box protein [Nitrospinota bacterium]